MCISTRSAHWLMLAFAWLLCAAPAASKPQDAKARGLGARIDAYVAPLVKTNNFSGVIAVAKRDAMIFQKAYGLASRELGAPLTPRSVFHIASVSKPFTAAAVMRLVEQGRIELHAPLSRVLPDYPNGDKLTVHHLLTHTSGIPNINEFPEYEDLQFKPHSTGQLVAYFKDKPLEFEPGERYRYSNSNYNLLAHIIERLSGVTFAEFIQREILSPLGMTSTGHPTSPSEIVPRLADGYAPEGVTGLERARYIDWSVKTGNGSLYSNAPDLLRFFRGIHRGKLLGAESLKLSFTPHMPNIGYGWFLTKANGRDIHHINGRSPGWAAQVDYYPDDEVTVIVLTNNYSSVATPVARAVGALHFGERHEPLPDLTKTLSDREIERVLGTYQFGPDYFIPDVAMIVKAGTDGIRIEYSNGYARTGLIPLAATRFLMRPFWQEAEFVIGPDGRATALKIASFTGPRIR